jgi:t-SNARE complex subunit (syntaxin)
MHPAMPESPKELAHDVAEEVRHLEQEAEEGSSARTPLIVLSGITVVVGVIVVVVLAVAFTAYYVTK